jgi:ribonuclease BN (tRNA processing enzyme)
MENDTTENITNENTITFLGTAGARVMVANQIQASGGMWMNFKGTEILVDPGPGCIVQSTKRKLKANKLKAIILSHRHLDHSGDMNIMVEAMTQGGFQPHGRIFLPSDALGPEPVIYSYLKEYIDGIEVLEAGKSYSVDGVNFTTPVRHIHGVETYGIKFKVGERQFSYIADSKYFDGLIENYRTDLIIINVVFVDNHFKVDHLSVIDAEKIISGIKPKIAILAHFGMQIWRAHPWEIAEQLTQKTGVKVKAARDGMKFDLAELDSV